MNAFETLIEKAGVEILNPEGIAIIAKFAAKEGDGVETVLNLLLNGPEDIIFEDETIIKIVESEKVVPNLVLTNVEPDYVNRRITVCYTFDGTRYFKDETETYWYSGRDEKNDEYKYQKTIKRSDSMYIAFDKYLSF